VPVQVSGLRGIASRRKLDAALNPVRTVPVLVRNGGWAVMERASQCVGTSTRVRARARALLRCARTRRPSPGQRPRGSAETSCGGGPPPPPRACRQSHMPV
jgi:hypothetical protein